MRRTGCVAASRQRPAAAAGAGGAEWTVSSSAAAASAQTLPKAKAAAGATAVHSAPAITLAGSAVAAVTAWNQPNVPPRPPAGARSAT